MKETKGKIVIAIILTVVMLIASVKSSMAYDDNLNMDEVLGTVAGDNCMFACLREGVTGDDFMEKLKKHIPGIES